MPNLSAQNGGNRPVIPAVTWSMTGPKTRMTRVMGVFKNTDKMVGPDFEKGLARLARRRVLTLGPHRRPARILCGCLESGWSPRS